MTIERLRQSPCDRSALAALRALTLVSKRMNSLALPILLRCFDALTGENRWDRSLAGDDSHCRTRSFLTSVIGRPSRADQVRWVRLYVSAAQSPADSDDESLTAEVLPHLPRLQDLIFECGCPQAFDERAVLQGRMSRIIDALPRWCPSLRSLHIAHAVEHDAIDLIPILTLPSLRSLRVAACIGRASDRREGRPFADVLPPNSCHITELSLEESTLDAYTLRTWCAACIRLKRFRYHSCLEMGRFHFTWAQLDESLAAHRPGLVELSVWLEQDEDVDLGDLSSFDTYQALEVLSLAERDVVRLPRLPATLRCLCVLDWTGSYTGPYWERGSTAARPALQRLVFEPDANALSDTQERRLPAIRADLDHHGIQLDVIGPDDWFWR